MRSRRGGLVKALCGGMSFVEQRRRKGLGVTQIHKLIGRRSIFGKARDRGAHKRVYCRFPVGTDAEREAVFVSSVEIQPARVLADIVSGRPLGKQLPARGC